MILHCAFLRELVGEGNPEEGKHRAQETLGDEGNSWAAEGSTAHLAGWGQPDKGQGETSQG